jgi:hypothetical protein
MHSNTNTGLAPTAANRPSLRELFTLKARVPGTFDSYDELMARLQQYPAVNFTKFVNNRGLATKKFTLENGKLAKSAHIQVWDGAALPTDAFGVRGVRDFVNGLQTNECALWGIPNLVGDTFEVTTKGKRKGRQISRTRDYIKYAEAAPGVLMLDFDARGGCEFESIEIEIEKLFSAVPELRKVQFVVSYSCSALIYHGETKLRGIGGFRMYFIARVAADIPAIGELITKRLWLADHGYMAVSSCGALLERCLVDASVWQPERCDFAARGVYTDGLTSRAPEAVTVEYDSDGNPLAPMLALRDLKPITSADTKKILALVADAKKAAAAEAATAREAWIESRAKPYVEKNGGSHAQACAILAGVLDGGDLPQEWELTLQGGDVVTVADILADWKKYHRAQFLDPIDPGHRDGRDYCATAYLNTGEPVIWSLAHGKTRYRLHTLREKLTLTAGGRITELDRVKEVLLESGVIVRNPIGGLAQVVGGKLVAFKPDGIALRLTCMRMFDTQSVKSAKGGDFTQITDFPDGHARDILADTQRGAFQTVAAVVDHPIIRPDGTILATLGHDQKTGLYIVENDQTCTVQIPDNPTPEDALVAARRLQQPLAEFPFENDAHRGVVLAAIMTAVQRPVMPEAPAFIFTAPMAGTGKSYLADCIAAIRLGERPPARGPSCLQGGEAPKEISTWIKECLSCILIDNVPPEQPFGNPDLDSLMTSGRMAKRQLGVNDSIDGQLRALFLVTGNNTAIQCDTSRRVLICKLDSKLERPKDREFLADPLQYILSNRGQIISDVLTIVHAWHCAGAPRLGKGRFASFGVWDDLIRQPICWLNSLGLEGVADPVETQAEAEAADVGRNNTAELLQAIYALQENGMACLEKGEKRAVLNLWEAGVLLAQVEDAKARELELRRTTPGALEDFRKEHAAELAVFVSLAEALGGAVANAGSKARSLGNWLKGKKDAPFEGLVLRSYKEQGSKHAAKYSVVVHTGG